jgi:hypothetical protein
MRRVSSYFIKFLKIPVSEKVLFLEAVFFLFTAKILLRLFSFKFCLKLLSCKKCIKNERSIKYLKGLKTALYRANRLAFWKNVCLVQSFAARWMLNRRGIKSQLSIGVAHDENKKLKAHAWLSAGQIDLVPENLGFTKLFYLD